MPLIFPKDLWYLPKSDKFSSAKPELKGLLVAITLSKLVKFLI